LQWVFSVNIVPIMVSKMILKAQNAHDILHFFLPSSIFSSFSFVLCCKCKLSSSLLLSPLSWREDEDISVSCPWLFVVVSVFLASSGFISSLLSAASSEIFPSLATFLKILDFFFFLGSSFFVVDWHQQEWHCHYVC